MATSQADREGERAVSPVIGVILMVAITVILAAVIGAFVLEIGDQQETAPSTSFDTEEENLMIQGEWGAYGGDLKYNTTEVTVSHAGGEVLDNTQTDLSVNGNTSVWGIDQLAVQGSNYDTYSGCSSCVSTLLKPEPDYFSTLGTNEPSEFTSGESWSVLTFSGSASEEVVATTSGPTALPPHENLHEDLSSDDDIPIIHLDEGYPYGNTIPFIPPEGPWFTSDPLETGDTVRAVWVASSGGKTQTLFKYTVQ